MPVEEKFWRRFCEVVERPELIQAVDWSDRMLDFGGQNPVLEAELRTLFRTRTLAEWIEILGGG